jgi:hypothetical protein
MGPLAPGVGGRLSKPSHGDISMKRLAAVAIVVAFSALIGVARADDKKDDKKDAKAGLTGTWKWSIEVNGQTRETTLKLKQDGDKLTGAVVGRNNMETQIEDATFKDGKVSFKVTRERNGTKTTTTYSGKLDGETLKLKAEREGQDPREIEAKRAKD